MSESTNIKDFIRKEGICALATIESLEGKGVAGVVVDAQLEAISIYLRGSIGAEAAFNVLTRHAESIITPLVQSRVKPR